MSILAGIARNWFFEEKARDGAKGEGLDLTSQPKPERREQFVEAWLGVRHYQVRIRHRLLAQLGRISHFLLITQRRRECSLDELSVLTGLPSSQLNPVIGRLQGLQLLRDLTLTGQGRQCAVAAEYLHGKTAAFWLDAGHHSPHMLRTDDPRITRIPQDAIVIGNRSGQTREIGRANRAEDEARQNASLKVGNRPNAWLPWLFPEFEHLTDRRDDWWRAWELDLKLASEEDGFGLPVELPVSEACAEPGGSPALKLSSPILQLTTHYTWPEGMSLPAVPTAVPPTTLYYDYVDAAVTESLPQLTTESCQVLPLPDAGDSRDQAAIACLQAARRHGQAIEDPFLLLDRRHTAVMLNRLHAFSWSAVRQRADPDGTGWREDRA